MPVDTSGGRSRSRRASVACVGQLVDVQRLDDRVGDPVGDRGLHARVARDRGDRLDVAVGVDDQVAGPAADDGDRRKERAEQDEDDRGSGPAGLATPYGRAPATRCGRAGRRSRPRAPRGGRSGGGAVRLRRCRRLGDDDRRGVVLRAHHDRLGVLLRADNHGLGVLLRADDDGLVSFALDSTASSTMTSSGGTSDGLRAVSSAAISAAMLLGRPLDAGVTFAGSPADGFCLAPAGPLGFRGVGLFSTTGPPGTR